MGFEIVPVHRGQWMGFEIVLEFQMGFEICLVHRGQWMGFEIVLELQDQWTGFEICLELRDQWMGFEIVLELQDQWMGFEIVSGLQDHYVTDSVIYLRVFLVLQDLSKAFEIPHLSIETSLDCEMVLLGAEISLLQELVFGMIVPQEDPQGGFETCIHICTV